VFQMSKTIGFTGSRKGFVSSSLVSAVVLSVLGAGHSVAVGCASGVDALVRRLSPSAQVFSVASPGAGSGLSFAAALARRSQLMVQACSVLVGFASVPCPSSVSPSSHFSGGGSGTWASIAYGISQGLQVFVFAAPGVSLPSWVGGQWAPAVGSGGLWSGAFVWQPSASQLTFFWVFLGA
jgi:hypothetical protein